MFIVSVALLTVTVTRVRRIVNRMSGVISEYIVLVISAIKVF